MDKLDAAGLESALANPAATPKELQDLLKKVALFKKFKPGRVFPKGIIRPDILEAHLDLKPAQFAEVSSALAANTSPVIRSWRVFPLGIINPERFHVQIELGKALQG